MHAHLYGRRLGRGPKVQVVSVYVGPHAAGSRARRPPRDDTDSLQLNRAIKAAAHDKVMQDIVR